MKFSKFKYNIGEHIISYNRDLTIINREYRHKIKTTKGKSYNANEKWYQYKCNICGNTDWISEYCLGDKMHIGCNACCNPPRKIVMGINDISTVAPWMNKYFLNQNDIYTHSPCSTAYVKMICPDCKTTYKKQIVALYANHKLSCICQDSMSYPNKFMYSLLKQLNLDFEIEKEFDWSKNKKYDNYIKFNGLHIITEQHGIQHYKEISNFSRTRTLKDEQANDNLKYHLAKSNGIDYYFAIDCSKSNVEYIKKSIIDSGLLNILNVKEEEINWNECDMFATSNIDKMICEYKQTHSTETLREIAQKFNTSYVEVLRAIKKGNRFGWCTYQNGDDRKMLENQQRIYHGEKPIYCVTNDTYYRSANVASQDLSNDSRIFHPRQIRKAITRGQNYLKHKFIFVDKDVFNSIKQTYPTKAVGEFIL